MRTRTRIITTALAAALLGVGCVDPADDCTFTKTCPPPPDAGAAPPPSDGCLGTCFPAANHYLIGPYLVWMGEGPPSNVCPDAFFKGTAPPSAPVCPACQCLPPSGSCALPATVMASASTCPSTPGLPLPAPSGWDGSCWAPPGPLGIEGGVGSVTVAPPIPIDGPCAPQMIMDPKLPHPAQTWSNVLGCQGSAGTCSDPEDVCLPTLPTVPFAEQATSMWTYCVTLGDPTKSCPMAFPIRREFSDGWTDVPTCTPCTCGAAVGSSCSTSTVTLYADGACTDEIGLADAQTSTSTCVDVTADSLGSMTATPSTYTPGTCPHMGGEVVDGPPLAILPMIFCCQE